MSIRPLPNGIGYTLGIIIGLIIGIITGFIMEDLMIGLALGPGMGFSMGLALEGENKLRKPSKLQPQNKILRNIAFAGVIILSIIVLSTISWSMILS